MRAIAQLAVAASILLCSPPAASQAPAGDIIVANWRVSQTRDTCQANRNADGHLAIGIVIQKASRKGLLFLQSNAWKLADGQPFAGSLSWDGWETSHAVDFSAESFGENRDGLIVASFEDWFIQGLATSSRLSFKVPQIYLGGEIVLDGLEQMRPVLEKCITGQTN